MYPLNMKLAAGVGFAVANDEAEHQSLSDAGYLPALVAADAETADEAEPAKRGPGRPRKVTE